MLQPPLPCTVRGVGTRSLHGGLLSNEQARFLDLGSGYYDTHEHLNRKMRNHVRELQHLGYKVTLEPAA